MSDIFISYRRDSVLAVDHVHEKLSERFKDGSVFLDRMDIEPGTPFPQRIRDAVAAARVVLVMIGRNWISAQDERTFRRRIELPDDWVHIEVAIALKGTATVIPVLIEGVPMPTREQFPEPLRALADRHAVTLSVDRFRDDAALLIEEIRSRLGKERAAELLGEARTRFPAAGRIVPSQLAPESIQQLSQDLPHWRLVESVLEGDPRFGADYKRQELVRDFRFDSFIDAIEFMRRAAKSIDDFGHHPRWENVFKTVTVHYSTWDIGHRPSDRDVKCAHMLEKIYREFLESL